MYYIQTQSYPISAFQQNYPGTFIQCLIYQQHNKYLRGLPTSLPDNVNNKWSVFLYEIMNNVASLQGNNASIFFLAIDIDNKIILNNQTTFFFLLPNGTFLVAQS